MERGDPPTLEGVTKYCKLCACVKPITAFRKWGTSNGRQNWSPYCRPCMAERDMEMYNCADWSRQINNARRILASLGLTKPHVWAIRLRVEFSNLQTKPEPQ